MAAALREVEGTYGIAVISAREPDTIVAARQRQPAAGRRRRRRVLRRLATPRPSWPHTRQVVYLDDGEMAVVTPDGLPRHGPSTTVPLDARRSGRSSWDLATIEQGGYAALHAQGDLRAARVASATRCAGASLDEEGTARLGGLNLTDEELRRINRIIITACGTSLARRRWSASTCSRSSRGIPVEVEYATEFRYRNPIIDERHAGHRDPPVGRDGRHAGGAARGEAARRARRWASCNVVGTTHRPRDGRRRLPARRPGDRRRLHQGVHQPGRGAGAAHAVPGRGCGAVDPPGRARSSQALRAAARPDRARCSQQAPQIAAARASGSRGPTTSCTWAAGYNFPVALEGALKLKEISYIHAEGYPAAEMKHGPIALIDEQMPVVFIAPRDAVYDKIMSQHRGGPGARRAGHRGRHRGRHRDPASWPTT